MALPTTPVESVLATCISKIADADRKDFFASISANLTASELAFIAAAETNRLHQFPTSENVGTVSKREMTWLYNSKMADARSSGRTIYDEIKMAAIFGRCPLCGRGTVYTLDHHLPKSVYPDLSITPANLVPACQDCNKNKTLVAPTCAAEETLHPYFDNIENDIWLTGTVLEVSPAAIVFSVAPPTLWSPVLAMRVRYHFKIYKLGVLYSSIAAEELSNIRQYLTDLHRRLGEIGVRNHLHEMVSSFRTTRRNSWQAAAYQAMVESDWFCAGGFAGLG